MRITWTVLARRSHRHPLFASAAAGLLRCAHSKTPRKQPATSPAPPKPPKPPLKPESFSLHDTSWEDPYSWMSKLNDKVAMRHMDMCMEQEEKYTEAVMSDTEQLQSKLMSVIASRLSYELSTPPLRWGPWYISLLLCLRLRLIPRAPRPRMADFIYLGWMSCALYR